MSVAINSKREQFRREIIKKEKEELFLQRRRQLMSNLQTESLTSPVQALIQGTNTKQAFERIKNGLEDVNFFARTMVYIEEGLIGVLMRYLQEGWDAADALEVLCMLISKKEEQLSRTATLYNHGILEHALNYLSTTPKAAAKSAFILSHFTMISSDYCEALLATGSHRAIIECFLQRVRANANAEEENKGTGERFFTMVLLTLEHLLQAENSVLEFPREKLEIFEFAVGVVQQRLFLKTSVGLLYEGVAVMASEALLAQTLPLVNALLAEVRPEDPYLHNLFALIFILTIKCRLLNLNFADFYKVGALARHVQRPLIKIMEQYLHSPAHAALMPRHEDWWLAILANPESSELHSMMLEFINTLDIPGEWVWRVYATALSDGAPTVQQEAIRLLGTRVRRAQTSQNLLTLLHKHRITNILESLTHNLSSSLTRDSATHLLEYILGTMTENEEFI